MKLRATHISSTESAALFGLSNYATAYEVGIEKQSGAPAFYFEETERMQWGKRLQDAIAQGLADDFKVVIEGLEYAYAEHPTELRMGSSFDFMIVDCKDDESPLAALFKQHGPGLLEIKNVDALQFKNWPEHDAPDHIEIQVQHQLEVSGLEWCVLGVLVGGNRTEVYTRMRDGQVGAAIVSRVREFWANLDKGILPPPAMPEDADLIIKLNQYAEPSKVFDGQDDALLNLLCDEYFAQQQIISAAEKLQKIAKAKILTHIGDAERALAGSYRVTAGLIAPADVKAYTRGGYRNFRVNRKEGRGQRPA
jgi:predicted phage-related endonuclease